MDIRFDDTITADYQDRVCSILASLCLMTDARKHMGDCNGNLRWVYQREMRYHYRRAVLDALRLLGILIHDTSITTNANLDRLCEKGHAALEELIEKYLYCFDTEVE
ncbi:MAG: hypothetical protein K2P41_05815 [Lachnospiraceae bacterium]|nr:hypothetical protein [Oscillospiraceae bacterium]MDE6993926.1 hypothetical protein [Lachnospiraceae bacterium]